MGTCKNHPERQTSYLCHKHRQYLCDQCLACSDPEMYCTFRQSCVIHFLTRKNGAAVRRETAHSQESNQGEQR